MSHGGSDTLGVVRGVLSCAGYLPYRRLDRSGIRAVAGVGGGRGTRTVASYDEDTTTMGVAAARACVRAAPDAAALDALVFSTVAPAYLDKTNATAIHAALRLDSTVPAFDLSGSVRSAAGTLRYALSGDQTTLVVSADVRVGRPGSPDESAGGDGAAALLIGSGDPEDLVAEYLGTGSATDEFLDRWRTVGDPFSRTWEERFGEMRYVPLGERAWNEALKSAGLIPEQIDHAIVTGLHGRAVTRLTGRLGVRDGAVVDTLASTVGNTGAAHPALLLTRVLERARPGEVVALVILADGADVFLFRTAGGVDDRRVPRAVDEQIERGAPIAYGTYLAWRGILPVEPPRRPEPQRVSASAASRTESWKFAFVGSRDRASGSVHLPPARVAMHGGAIDDMDPRPMADVTGTIVTFTIDRLAYSPSPPVVFAVVDFDGGGRLPVELTDVDADAVAIGDRVEMTFRRLFTADGIHNYFWKARPVR